VCVFMLKIVQTARCVSVVRKEGVYIYDTDVEKAIRYAAEG